MELQCSQKDSHDVTQLPEVEQVVWPGDTLFRDYELVEELQHNLEEKKQLHHLKHAADAPGKEQEDLAEEAMKKFTCCGTLSKKVLYRTVFFNKEPIKNRLFEVCHLQTEPG
ncbi:hypothetical protein MHYP_G00074970 [Metynnis hypsauchen]